jgi:hypothetical protein
MRRCQASVTLTVDSEERQLVLMALGELLGSVSREEHLTPALQQTDRNGATSALAHLMPASMPQHAQCGTYLQP